MKLKLILLLILLFPLVCFCQVDNFDILTKGVKKNRIKTITKFFIINNKIKQKEFEIEFNQNGQIETLTEYRYLDTNAGPIIMKQKFIYDSFKNIAIIINAPDGSKVIDSLVYNLKDSLILKNRYLNGILIKSKKINSSIRKIVLVDKKDRKYKEIIDDESFLLIEYDKNNNEIKRTEYKKSKIYETEIFEYNESELVTKSYYILNYIEIDKKPLEYHYEYTKY